MQAETLSPLVQNLRDAIERSSEKAISFAQFMKTVLYHPQWGYYSSEKQRIGKEGDYYTSLSLHPVFAQVLAE